MGKLRRRDQNISNESLCSLVLETLHPQDGQEALKRKTELGHGKWHGSRNLIVHMGPKRLSFSEKPGS